jgi:hypothetical protein
MSPVSERFGFLPIYRAIQFNSGTIDPLPELARRISEVRMRTHRDGNVYPPMQVDHGPHVVPPKGHTVERPALLHNLPASHTLTISGATVDPSPRSGDTASLMHFVGFMLGYRVQFDGW